MSTATTDVREIFARVEHGMAGCREAKVLRNYIEHLTWKPEPAMGRVIEICRHCGTIRGGEHTGNCPAQQVE